MLAGIIKTPELAIDKTEADTIAAAAAQVAELYNIEASAHMVAWTNLLMTLGMVYGPRVVVMMSKPKAQPKVINIQAQAA